MIHPVRTQKQEVDLDEKFKATRRAREKLYEATKLYLMAYDGYSHGGIKNGRRRILKEAVRALEEANQ